MVIGVSLSNYLTGADVHNGCQNYQQIFSFNGVLVGASHRLPQLRDQRLLDLGIHFKLNEAKLGHEANELFNVDLSSSLHELLLLLFIMLVILVIL